MNKDKIKMHPEKYHWMLTLYNKILGCNKIRIKGNSTLKVQSSMLKRCKVQILGDDNVVEIRSLTRMNDTTIYVAGNHNHIVIEAENGFEQSTIWVEEDGNTIEIGAHNRFFKGTELVAMEGTKLSIGGNGLFAPGVQVRTGDSHSMLDLDGKRTNPSADIRIGDHVWASAEAVILKGSVVPSDSVVGIRSVVTKAFAEPNGLYAGTPAKLVKSGINWDSQRI